MCHACWYKPVIPATQEVEIGRIALRGQPRQKVKETSSEQISQVWWYTCGLSYKGGISRGMLI
jgi:hypothetical protein